MSNQAFNFQLSQPSGQLSAFVQGIWSASVSGLQSDPVVKPLYSDAGSGILFNLAGGVKIGHETLPEGVIMLPVKKVSENIVLSPGAKIAGIRFHPAIGYGVLGQHFDKPTRLSPAKDGQYHFYQIYAELRMQKESNGQIEALYQWADNHLSFTNMIPVSLERALKGIEIGDTPGQLNENIQLSQRQIERLFQFWLGMTPKHYQRILRVKKAINFLRRHKNANLADVAQQFGFSDQAHMTREFRVIACITPGKI
ncbi:helix-turn-helix domain-containing protein [Photobacterium atrarenae]|uniref:Helix-turn-helix domain-containing protein n=1 Tax=Photobacterium atrarenae TaxID=865757 RepID=A0ABY5GMU9_9GAMM|nr:helix-turn-helix domain-containing protein [Photobacterium atrarenae]UTV30649.1 helix-turn-helix domain-containing protein [Photobacterium atrarenae]